MDELYCADCGDLTLEDELSDASCGHYLCMNCFTANEYKCEECNSLDVCAHRVIVVTLNFTHDGMKPTATCHECLEVVPQVQVQLVLTNKEFT